MSDSPNSKNPQGYLEVAIIIERRFEEIFSNFIIREIASGLVTEDLNSHVKITCYLSLGDDPQAKLAKIKKYLSLMEILPADQIENKLFSKKIKALDWIGEYQRGFKSVMIDDLIVKTPWDDEVYAGKKVIILEPKMAFGTGKHETTQLCLRALKKEIQPGVKMLDLGTGSGILSIYAALLGAAEVLGLDIDPEAVRNARENATVNGVAQVFIVRPGSMEQVSCEKYYDLVVSNLIYEGIIDLFDSFLRTLKSGGKLILSGILDSQQARLSEFISERISADTEIMRQNEWLCYILRT